MSGAFGNMQVLSLSTWHETRAELDKEINSCEDKIAKLRESASSADDQEPLYYQRTLSQALRLSWQWRRIARFCDLHFAGFEIDDNAILERAISILSDGIKEYKAKQKSSEEHLLLAAQLEFAILLNDEGRNLEAIDLAEEATQRAYSRDSRIGSELSNFVAGKCASFLSKLYQQADNKRDAMAAYEEIVGMQFTDADRADATSTLLKEPLVKAYEQGRRLEETGAVLQRTISARARLCDETDPFLTSAQAMLDEVLAEQKKCREATALLEHVLTGATEFTISYERQHYYDVALAQERTEAAA